jgi:hypothetical protein
MSSFQTHRPDSGRSLRWTQWLALVALAAAFFRTPLTGQVLYVSNYLANTVEKFSTNGTHLGTISTGAGSGPVGLAVDGAGSLYVMAAAASKVMKFDASGASQGEFAVSAGYGLAIAPNGNLYLSTQTLNSVLVYNTSGSLLQTVTDPAFNTPVGLTFGPDGDLYVANQVNYNVLRFSAAGVSQGVFATLNVGSAGQTYGLAFRSDGKLFASDLLHQHIEVFNSDGTYSNTLTGNTLNLPGGLAFDTTGTLYVVSRGQYDAYPHRVGESLSAFDASGSYSGILASSPLNGPMFVAVSSVPEPADFAVFAAAGVFGLAIFLKSCPSKSQAKRFRLIPSVQTRHCSVSLP